LAVITSMWVLNTLAGIFKWNDYNPSATIDGIFLTIVGGAFTFYWSGKGRQNGDDTKQKQRGGDHRG
jgi:hypothetical protein